MTDPEPLIYPPSDGTVTRNDTLDGQVGDPSFGFDDSKAMRPDQFDFELSAAMDWDGANLVSHGDPRYATPDAPAQLWCCRADMDEATFLTLAAAHVPDPGWTPDGPPISFASVKAKAAAGGRLNSDEIQFALAGLLAIAPS